MALLGLKKAISEGNIRVMHLLMWAGLHDHSHDIDLTWSIHNAGGDRFETINHLVNMGLYRIKEEHESELESVEHDAELIRDGDTLALVKELRAGPLSCWE